MVKVIKGKVEMKDVNIQIIKRNGKKEDFNIKKIETSLINTAKELDMEFTKSDLKLVLKSIEQEIMKLHPVILTTNVYEIRGLILSELNKHGFKQVADKYGTFLKEV